MESYLVIGIGRFGSSLSRELSRLGHDVLVIDKDENLINDISDDVTHAVIGDAKDEGVIRSLGVSNFDCCVVAIADFLEDSILTTLLLKELGAKRIICKAKNLRHAKALELIGADEVITPEIDMAKHLARSLNKTNVINYMDISDDHQIAEIRTPKKWVNKTIVESNIRQTHGVRIIAIRKHHQKDITALVMPDTMLEKDDVLIILGTHEAIDNLSDYRI